MIEAPRVWRNRKTHYSLIGENCEKGHKVFPPRDICPDCGSEAKELFQFSGRGTVYSHTTVYDAPEGYEVQAPYEVALVKLEEGPMVTAQLTDLDPTQAVEIGMPVEMVTRKITQDGDRGLIVYGYKFRPALKR